MRRFKTVACSAIMPVENSSIAFFECRTSSGRRFRGGQFAAYSPEIFVLSLLAAFGIVVAMFSAAPQSRRGAPG